VLVVSMGTTPPRVRANVQRRRRRDCGTDWTTRLRSKNFSSDRGRTVAERPGVAWYGMVLHGMQKNFEQQRWDGCSAFVAVITATNVDAVPVC